MKRFARFAIVLAAVAALALLAGELWLESLIAEPGRRFAERRLTAASGLEVELRGDFDVGFLPALRIRASELTFREDPAGDPILSIDDIALDVDPWRLLSGVVAIDELHVDGARVNLASIESRPQLDVASLTTPMERDARLAIDLSIERVDVDELRVEFRDSSGAVQRLQIERLALGAATPETPISLSLDGSFGENAFDVTGEIGPARELLHPTGPYPVSLHGTMPATGVEVGVEGHLAEPTSLRGVDVALSIRVPEITALLSGLDLDAVSALPPLGPAQATGRLRAPDGVLAVEKLHIDTPQGSQLQLVADGSIGDLLSLSGVDVEARLSTAGLAILQPFADTALPAVDHVDVRASLSDRTGSLAGRATAIATGPNGAFTLKLSGEEGDLRHVERLDVAFDAEARDLASAGKALMLDWPLPAIGPVTARGVLREDSAALAIEELRLRAGQRSATWLELDGELKDLANLTGVHLVARFGGAGIHQLLPTVERALPDLGPLRGGATLSDRDGRLGLEGLRVEGGRAGAFAFDLSGNLDDLREVDEISLDAKLEASNLETVGALFGAHWPPVGPVSFAGHVTGSDEKISARGETRLADIEFVAAGSAAMASGKRPVVRARVESPHVRLDSIVRPSAGPLRADAARDREPGFWRGTEALPFDRLRALDAHIEFVVDHLSGGDGLEFLALDGVVELEDGRLLIREAGAGYAGGSISGEMRIDASAPDPVATLKLEANGVGLASSLRALGHESDSTGVFDLSMAIDSRGASPSALRSNLAGAFSALMRGGSIASDYGKLFVTNVIGLSLPALLSPEPARFGCIAMDFGIESGVATVRTLVVDSKDVLVVGTGNIDLARDAFDLVLSPEARTPGLLGLSAEVEVTGPIAHPKFHPRARTIPSRVARGVIRNALAPVSAVLLPVNQNGDGWCDGLLRPTRAPQ